MSVTEAVGPMWILFPDAWRAGRRVAAGQPACAGCPRPPVSAGPSGWFRGREPGVGCTSCSGPGLSSGWVASHPFTSDFPLEDGAHVTPSTVPDGAGGFGAGVKQGTPQGLGGPVLGEQEGDPPRPLGRLIPRPLCCWWGWCLPAEAKAEEASPLPLPVPLRRWGAHRLAAGLLPTSAQRPSEAAPPICILPAPVVQAPAELGQPCPLSLPQPQARVRAPRAGLAWPGRPPRPCPGHFPASCFALWLQHRRVSVSAPPSHA